MSERYQIRGGSQSAHCCFSCTVVDTARPVMMHGEPYIPPEGPEFEPVCECFYEDDAKLICEALNKMSREDV